MFAFGGASTFPTIQADMADKTQFKWAAMVAVGSKILQLKFRLKFTKDFL
jgi:hypothetical protein